MITFPSYITLNEIIPQDELHAWRATIKKVEAKQCPPEVREFITALSAKLPDFGQIRKYNEHVSGFDLLQEGIKEFNGALVNPWEVYTLPVPYMVAVDHHTAMHRIFHRRGKQGLINYCRARVKGTELERLLEILNVHVFKHERTEFQQVMHKIKEAKKADSL